MEYRARIVSGQKLEISNLWKYEFLDVENNQQDYFYHSEPIDYNPNSVGKLTLTFDKYFKSFEKEIKNIVEGFDKADSLVRIEGWLGKTIENTVDKFFNKKIKLFFDVRHLHQLHSQGYTWKQVAKFYDKHEQSVYYWLRTRDKVLQKRGTKSRITDEVVSLVLSYTLENKTRTQNEIANYIYEKLGVVLSQPSICVLLKKLGITRKKLTYHYTQLDEVKAKEFNEEIKPLLLNNVPFIALDECSFYPKLDPKFGYYWKGERAVSKKPGHKGKHYTLLLAISNQERNGVIKWKLTGEIVNWKVFYDFLEEINPIGDKKNILLMDNSRVHTAKKQKGRGKIA